MGFAGGTVLEPGCGTGLFLALMPEALVGKSAFTAVEMDPCTAQIATLLHPDAWVRCEDFTKARIADHIERMRAFGVSHPAAAFWLGIALQFTGCALIELDWHPAPGALLVARAHPSRRNLGIGRPQCP